MSLIIDPVLTGAYPRLIGEGTSNNHYFPAIYLHSANSYRVGLYGHRIDLPYPGQNIPTPGEKTIITVTYSGGISKLYVNGNFAGELATSSLPVSSIEAYLGANAGTARYYKGKIYNFLMYDRALTEEEIEHNVMVDRFRFGT